MKLTTWLKFRWGGMAIVINRPGIILLNGLYLDSLYGKLVGLKETSNLLFFKHKRD